MVVSNLGLRTLLRGVAIVLGALSVAQAQELPTPLLRFATTEPVRTVQRGRLHACAPNSVPEAALRQRMDSVAALRALVCFEWKLTPVIARTDAWLLFDAQLVESVPRAAAQFLPAYNSIILPSGCELRTFLHEATHLVLHDLLPGTTRSFWLEEGLAELCSDATGERLRLEARPSTQQRWTQHHAAWRGAAGAARALTLAEVLDAAPQTRDDWLRSDADRAHMFMAEAHALVLFLRHVDAAGTVRPCADNTRLRHLLRSETRNANPLHGRDALIACLGGDIDLAQASALFARWLRWLAQEADASETHGRSHATLPPALP